MDGAGLWLQVSPSRSKSWIFRFTLSGKQREIGLGAVHTVNLTEALAKAKECRQLLLEGKDPLDARRSIKQAEALERAKAMSFEQCAAPYTFRDWCAESTNFPREVCEHALAHSLPDKVEAAYRRGDLIDKRVQLMKAWADFCAKPAAETSAAKVTPIRRKRAAK